MIKTPVPLLLSKQDRYVMHWSLYVFKLATFGGYSNFFSPLKNPMDLELLKLSGLVEWSFQLSGFPTVRPSI
jgi:hypothetical protein